MGLCLFFLPNFPEATFIQRATFIPDSRVKRGLDYTALYLATYYNDKQKREKENYIL